MSELTGHEEERKKLAFAQVHFLLLTVARIPSAVLTIITESSSTTGDEHSIPEELFAQQTHYLLGWGWPVWGRLHLLL